ncbi:MAG: hypothetical protein ABI315_05270 [Bacteroidia bacterium]
MIYLKHAAKVDPVKGNAEKGLEQMEHSPMYYRSTYEQLIILEN